MGRNHFIIFFSAPVTSTFSPESPMSLTPTLSSTGRNLFSATYKTFLLRGLVPVNYPASACPLILSVILETLATSDICLIFEGPKLCLVFIVALPENQLLLAPYCLSNLSSSITFSERPSRTTFMKWYFS